MSPKAMPPNKAKVVGEKYRKPNRLGLNPKGIHELSQQFSEVKWFQKKVNGAFEVINSQQYRNSTWVVIDQKSTLGLCSPYLLNLVGLSFFVDPTQYPTCKI